MTLDALPDTTIFIFFLSEFKTNRGNDQVDINLTIRQLFNEFNMKKITSSGKKQSLSTGPDFVQMPNVPVTSVETLYYIFLEL
jgi:hypothetical protein